MVASLFSSLDPVNQVHITTVVLATGLTLFILSNPAGSVKDFLSKAARMGSTFMLKEQAATRLRPVYYRLFLARAFVSIVFVNLLGLVPFGFSASRHPNYTVAIAAPLWLSSLLWASTANPKNLISHLVPLGCPVALSPFIVLVERVSILIRPVTLSVRLASNMVAGHLILIIIREACTLLRFCSGVGVALILLQGLELAVAVIQGYVLVSLCGLYLSEVG